MKESHCKRELDWLIECSFDDDLDSNDDGNDGNGFDNDKDKADTDNNDDNFCI